MEYLLVDILIMLNAYFLTVGRLPFYKQVLHPTTFIFIPLIILWFFAFFDKQFFLYSNFSASLVIIIFSFFVVLGHLIGDVLFVGKSDHEITRLVNIEPTKFSKLLLLGIFAILVYDFSINVLPDISTYTLNVRLKLMSGEISQPFVYRFFQPLFMVFASVIAFSGSTRKPYKELAFLVLVALLYDFLKVDKGTLKVLAVVVIAYLYAKKDFKTGLSITFLFALGFLLITYMRTTQESIYSLTVDHLYNDTVGNVFSYYWSILYPFPSEYHHTFPEISRALFEDVKVGTNVDNFYLADVGSVYNTFPAMSYVYADFGYIGIGFLGLAFSLFNQFSFKRAARKQNWLVSLPIISSGYVFLFRGFAFGALGIWVSIFFCIFLPKFFFNTVKKNGAFPSKNISIKYDENN